MKVVTAEQMREFDRRAEEEYGIPSIVLMENAGLQVFEAALDALDSLRGKHIVVIAGSGNNGGDGLVAARHLRQSGANVQVILLSDIDKVGGDARQNLEILIKQKFPIEAKPPLPTVHQYLEDCDLIIDAIFGTGLKGEVKGLAADIIQLINSASAPVISVDIPSGLDANTGQILGICVKADVTITLALPKLGLLVPPGAEYVGRLVIGDIGIPEELSREVKVELAEAEYIANKLPERPFNAHKGLFGTVLVIAGSKGLTGAAAMAGEAALRAGAGLSVVAVPESLQDVMAAKLTEVMTRGLPETKERTLSADALSHALELEQNADAVVVGCGLSTHPETCEFVHNYVRTSRKPLVIDADGLNALARATNVLTAKQTEVVLTPHPGEMARLLDTNVEAIQSDRLNAAKEAASRFGCVVVLKGAHSLIAAADGRVVINPTGGPGLATGGTGDVLAGVIGGLLAQGLSTWDAAICGTYIHGLAGDIVEADIGSPGMIAGDVCRAIPKAFREIRSLIQE